MTSVFLIIIFLHEIFSSLIFAIPNILDVTIQNAQHTHVHILSLSHTHTNTNTHTLSKSEYPEC